MFYDMKKIGIVIVVISIVIATTTVVVAPPMTPESYDGYATLDGATAPIGTLIRVEVYGTGEVVSESSVTKANGGYTVTVCVSDEDKPNDNYALNGSQLTWKMDGIECSIPAPGTDTAVSERVNHNFNITASHPAPPPPPVAVPEYNVMGLLALIGILTIALAFATLRRK